MFYFDPTYIVLVLLPTVILSGLAQMYVRNAYAKWGKVRNGSGFAGPDTARRIMSAAGLNVNLEGVQQHLGDHYDPSSHTVRMSPDVARTSSVASMAIVAHELGHAQQHQEKSILITARNFLVPAVQVSPMLSYGMIFAGLLLNFTGLAWIGVGLFSIAVIFMFLTLPVEIDASRRGIALLENSGLMVTAEDRSGARAVLTAAALTYVAAAVTSLLTLVYYISLVNRRD